MENKQAHNDLEKVINNNQDEELEELSAALKTYMDSRKMNASDTKDQVDLLFVIFCILEIPEGGLEEFISRLNIIQLAHLGVVSTGSNGNIH